MADCARRASISAAIEAIFAAMPVVITLSTGGGHLRLIGGWPVCICLKPSGAYGVPIGRLTGRWWFNAMGEGASVTVLVGDVIGVKELRRAIALRCVFSPRRS